MESLEFWFYLSLFIGVAALCFRAAVATDRSVRTPLAIYLIVYSVTTLAGGIWMSATNGAALAELNWGVDLTVLADLSSLRYWSLLFAPLIVPAVTIIALKPFQCESLIAAPLQSVSQRVSTAGLLAVWSLFFGYCLWRLFLSGCLFNFLQWFRDDSDYMSMILVRQATETLGSVFFGIAYITLPTLTFVALYQYRRFRSWDWLMVLGICATSTVFVNMQLMQKAPTLLFLLFLGVGVMELRWLSYRYSSGLLVALVAAVTMLQSLVLDNWTWYQSVQLLVFRMAHSFPYYVNLYPDVLPYSGIESGFHLVGMGQPATDCWDVFNYMYPHITWVQGAAPAAAHVRAYSQGGVSYALATLLFIGMVIKMTGGLRARITGPIGFAFYMQLTVFLYFVTQTSLRESIISCYGIFWAAVALTPLVFLQPASGGALQPTCALPLRRRRLPTTAPLQ